MSMFRIRRQEHLQLLVWLPPSLDQACVRIFSWNLSNLLRKCIFSYMYLLIFRLINELRDRPGNNRMGMVFFGLKVCVHFRSCLREAPTMMKWTLSFWGTWPINHGFCKPIFLQTEQEVASNAYTCGLILLLLITPTRWFGTTRQSRKLWLMICVFVDFMLLSKTYFACIGWSSITFHNGFTEWLLWSFKYQHTSMKFT